VPGVALNGAGGASSLPALHGLAGDRVRVRLDGMDLIASCPNHMNPPLAYLEPSAVARLAATRAAMATRSVCTRAPAWPAPPWR